MSRPLTFGIEFEFAFAVSPLNFNPPPSEATDGHPLALRSNTPPSQAAKLLHEAFLAINTLLNTHGLETTLTPPDHGTTRIGLRSHDNLQWHLESDSTIRGPNRNYHWLQIELISPILTLTPEGIEEARQVPHLIKQNFRVSTNTSTGMHVHIGDNGLPFSLETCQRIMGFFYVFDEQLKYLHPPSRRDREYARNIRQACMLNISNSWSVVDSLDAIMDTDTIEELEFGFGGRRPAVNLKNLRPGADPNKKTIEFRQHAGTLDDDRVEAWVRTVGGIVDWCREASEEEYDELVRESAQEEDDNQPLAYPTAVDLLREIGLKDPAKFYKKRLAKTKGKEPEGEKIDDSKPLSEVYVQDSSDSNDSSSSSDGAQFSDMDLD